MPRHRRRIGRDPVKPRTRLASQDLRELLPHSLASLRHSGMERPKHCRSHHNDADRAASPFNESPEKTHQMRKRQAMINMVRVWGTAMSAALFVAGCGGGGDGGASVAGSLDKTAPTVTYVTPANNAGRVGTNARLTATFSEAMSEASLASAIGLVDEASGSAIALQSITFDRVNNIATITPQAPLTPDRVYRAEVSTSARDLGGNPLADAYGWRFSTGGGADTTAPTVTSHAPVSGATGVPTDTGVALSFSEPMDVASVGAAFALTRSGTVVAGKLAYV